ncbi:hypothetical protein [Pandoraea terrigena]|uniref:Uncharacterized protein n=1 Tax=Pandoraea terrigena TaxID=2508292 RepID=A0A5E4UQ06_9BURK|nr:hypothetical protein [Pandoraea terrigena]VVE01624.1 hypothetical protein PTE31013_02173 [Pandoraea terrigena]
MSKELLPIDRKSKRREPHVLPVEDGPYEPWLPPATAEQVRQWQKELDTAIAEFAALADWSDELLERVLFQVERQPVSTLLPDLHWFRSEVQAAIVARATSMEHRR